MRMTGGLDIPAQGNALVIPHIFVRRRVAPGRPDPRACKGRAIDVNTQTLGIPILFTCSFPARRWGRDPCTRAASPHGAGQAGHALLAHDSMKRSNVILRALRMLIKYF
jgi:hypothetical protein